MTQHIVIDPLNRQNLIARVEVELDGHRVVEARIGNSNLRGFELLLLGRDPADAPWFSQRICGICSTAHGVASAMALEDAYGASVPPNGLLLRNLIFGADLLQNHIRHFYLLALPDWATFPERPPYVPRHSFDSRFSPAENARLLRNYEEAIRIGQKAHALLVVFGTRAPHQQAMLAGGVATAPTADRIMQAGALLSDLRRFVAEALVPDTELLAERYPDYFTLGRRPVNLLSYGMFPHPSRPGERYYPAGAVIDGRREEMEAAEIAEDVTHAWFRDPSPAPRHPARGRTDPTDDLSTGYTFTKASRYRSRPMEGGPLVRAWLRGDYRRGVSAMDRILTRSYEARQVAAWMEEWLKAVQPGEPAYTPPTPARSATGAGLHDAMRGPLGHWVRIRGGRIAGYQIVTPSAWNLSPRDGGNRRGPAEEALIGTEVADPAHPVEIMRVVHSFDPCSACSVHLLELDRTRGDRP
ncbi:MAG: nickel-dependent hydrogenase large subunit [Bacillota bacterium]|nr:nickel-dependent hydrogenase large subunit [Bacillota bacterium]